MFTRTTVSFTVRTRRLYSVLIEEYFADIVTAYREEIAELYELGLSERIAYEPMLSTDVHQGTFNSTIRCWLTSVPSP